LLFFRFNYWLGRKTLRKLETLSHEDWHVTRLSELGSYKKHKRRNENSGAGSTITIFCR